MSANSRSKTALFISAHADDTALCAGGVILRLLESGWNIVDCTLSKHRGVEVNYAESIVSEHHAAMQTLGVSSYTLLDYEACTADMFTRAPEIRAMLERLMEDHKPELVFSHSNEDTNQDHALVAEEVRRVFHRDCSTLSYFFPYNLPTTTMPQVFIRLSKEQLDRKVRAVQCYGSQIRPGHNYMETSVIMGWSIALASMAMRNGSRYAEAFFCERIVGTWPLL